MLMAGSLRACAGVRTWAVPGWRSISTARPVYSAWQAQSSSALRPTAVSGKSVRDIMDRKGGDPITCVTAYDYPTALAVRGADVDICLVGDSLTNVAMGRTSTRSLTLDRMIHHAQSVQEAVQSVELRLNPRCSAPPIVVVDMPFGTFNESLESAVRNVTSVIQSTQASAVKMEGSKDLVPLVEQLTAMGVAVMGHIGLQPQRVDSVSGMRVQGSTADSALDIYETARALEKAGCFSFVLECLPSKIAQYVTSRLSVPTIGIGAGPYTDGQVLVCTDIVADLTSPSHVDAVLVGGTVEERTELPAPAAQCPPHWPSGPRFTRSFAQPLSVGALRVEATRAFVDAVRQRTFPDLDTESYRIKSSELKDFVEKADALP